MNKHVITCYASSRGYGKTYYELEKLKKSKKKLKYRIEKAINHIEDTCYYPELDNISNMTSDEVEELLEILKGYK